jgi:hypothetical protein
MRTDRVRIAELVLLVTVAAAFGPLLSGAAIWLAGVGVGVLAALGAFAVLYEHEPRGVPIESLLPVAVAGAGMLGLTHAAGVSVLALLALLVGAALVAASVVLERRLLEPAGPGAERRRNLLDELSVLVAFVAFVGVAGAVPGGLAEPGGPGGSPPLDGALLGMLVAGDAAVAFLLGYRLAAVRMSRVRDAAFAAGTFAVMVGVAAGVLRALALPRLVGPALIAAVFALWAAYRAAPGSERRSLAWLWEYGILALAAGLTVAWNLLMH